MPAHRTETLHRHARAGKFEIEVRQRGLDGYDQAEAGGAKFIQRNATQFARQPDGAADLVFDAGHGELIGAHVGTEDVILDIAERTGEGADAYLFVSRRHRRVGAQHGFAAAMRQAGRRIF